MWWAEAHDGCNLLVWLSACFHVVRAGIWPGVDCGVRYSALAGDAGLYLCLVSRSFVFPVSPAFDRNINPVCQQEVKALASGC